MVERDTTESQHGTEQPTIIVADSGRRSGGGTWLIGIVLLIAVIAGIYFFTQNSGSEAVKDNAIANAADQVGDAAQQVGNAAQDAADTLKQR
jgi:hypothetical protein